MAEMTPKQISELCNSKFSIELIVTFENYMLEILSWNLDIPSAYEISRSLLRHTCDKFDYSSLAALSDSYAAICYTDGQLCFESPFILAIASVCCALDKFNYQDFEMGWLNMVKKEFPFEVDHLKAVIVQINQSIDMMKGVSEDQSTRSSL